MPLPNGGVMAIVALLLVCVGSVCLAAGVYATGAGGPAPIKALGRVARAMGTLALLCAAGFAGLALALFMGWWHGLF